MNAAEVAFLRLDFEDMIVYSGGSYYVLRIENRDKADAFRGRFESEVDPNNNWWIPRGEIDEFLESKRTSFEGLGGHEQLAYQLTAVLENFDSGMRLLRMDSNGSTEAYSVAYTLNGLTLQKCR